MPSKERITRTQIIEAALSLARREGEEALSARGLSRELHCSTQPIFRCFASMEEVRAALLERVHEDYLAYMADYCAGSGLPPYKASGLGYISYAGAEPELFRLLFMRDRSGEPAGENAAIDEQVEAMIRESTGLSPEEARLFHLESWAFVHGIAAMFATGFLAPDEALISRMLTDVYQGLRARFLKEDKR